MSTKKRFLLRLNDDLYDILEKWAADELRSVNAQIEYLLHDAARRAHRFSAPQLPGGGNERGPAAGPQSPS
jgi:hypothetical protein